MIFEKDNNYLVNEKIRFENLLLINQDGSKIKISRNEALEIARKEDIDLVCVSPNSLLPVCKLMDYKKYLFNLGKKKKRTKKVIFKEIKFRLNTNKRDLLILIDKIKNWMNSGESIVKAILNVRGREKFHPDISYEKCREVVNEIENTLPFVEIKNKDPKKKFHFYIQKKQQNSNLNNLKDDNK